MNPKPDKQSIEAELIRIIQSILEDDTIAIDPEKSLMRVYGLDSLDLLDFAFNIEERYGVKIGATELKGRTRMPADEMFDEDGNISLRAIEELKRNIPEIPAEEIAYGLRPEDIPTLLNIRVFTRIVYERCNG